MTAKVNGGGLEMQDKLLLSEDETLARLGIGKTLLRKLDTEGLLRSVRLGRRRLWPVATVTAYVDGLREAAPAAINE